MKTLIFTLSLEFHTRIFEIELGPEFIHIQKLVLFRDFCVCKKIFRMKGMT